VRRLCYWGSTLAAEPENVIEGEAPLSESADVAIVGAGLTGLSAALALGKAGARVSVLEAHDAGWGASSRNGGMVLSGLKVTPHQLVARFGLDEARRLDALSIAAIDFVERLVRAEQIECDFARCGHLALASKPSHYEELTREAALIAQRFGRHVQLVTRENLHEEIGSSAYFGGLVDEASASVNPAKLVRGLAQAARRAGVTIHEHTPVEHVERRTNGAATQFRVKTASGEVRARDVILATGAYTGFESPWLRRRIIPIGSYIIATEPLPETLARAISPRSRMMYDSKRFLHYFRLTPDRRMLFGGRASFVPESERAIAESAEILRRDMLVVFPQLRDAQVEYVWGGTIDFTADMLPHAGVIEGTHYAAGYAGHGVAMATYLGAKVAGTISGAATEEDPLMRLPFPAPPFSAHRVFPGLLPVVGAWYRFLDMVS
jgi:glycine/D-amino acid oxidase-like deaminating enzyme